MFTLSNPLLLWFLPVLALPWIFRRRQEERIRHIHFPLLQFLRESQEKELVNPQMQELLLLILRTLLLAMLILSLAGPRWMSSGGLQQKFFSFLPLGGAAQNRLAVVDSSYSMGYGQSESSWWRKAEHAWNEIDGAQFGFSPLLLCWDSETVNPEKNSRLIALSAVERDSLFAATPKGTGTTIPPLLDALKRSFPDGKSVILITDGQRWPWTPLLDGTVNPQSVPPMVAVTVGENPVQNIWCEVNLLSSPPWGIAGWETVAGNVRGILNEPFSGGTITITRTDSNETLYSQAVTLPDTLHQPVQAGYEFTAQFSSLQKSLAGGIPGSPINITLRTDPADALPIDNEVRLQIPTVSSFKTGVVYQEGTGQAILTILQSAINPLRDRIDSPPVTIEKITLPHASYDENLDLILLGNELGGAAFTPADAQAVLEYLKTGGSVLYFTGGNEAEGAWKQFQDSLGWIKLEANNSVVDIATIASGRGGQLGHMLEIWDTAMWKVWVPERHGRMDGEGVLPLVSYRAGEQTALLITQAAVGKGRIWIVNTSLLPERGTLLSPILPALLWETGKEVARAKHGYSITMPASSQESDLTLLTDEEKQTLNEKYGIRFTDYTTLRNELESAYGGSDLRILLLFGCLVLALGESWLSNRLASL